MNYLVAPKKWEEEAIFIGPKYESGRVGSKNIDALLDMLKRRRLNDVD